MSKQLHLGFYNCCVGLVPFLIHLHLHFMLTIGERLLKNYRVPWENVLLTRAILHPTLPVRILEPTSEAVLLVVRACADPKSAGGNCSLVQRAAAGNPGGASPAYAKAFCGVSQLQRGRGADAQCGAGAALDCGQPEQACSPRAATME